MIGPFQAGGYQETDQVSGLTMTRVTDGIGHHEHLYFTTNPWTNDYGSVLVRAERAVGWALYRVDCASGEATRLSDPRQKLGGVSRHHNEDRVALWQGHDLGHLDLHSGEFTRLWQRPEGTIPHSVDFTADASHLITAVTRDWSAQLGPRRGVSTDAERAHIGKDHDARLVAVPLDDGPVRELHRSPHLITHVNASPTMPDVLTFCHEGPWLEIDQRIWGLRLSGGDPWPIIPKQPEWGIGHEFWCTDGETIGYHARYCEGTWRHAAGFVRFDNSDHWQAELTVPTHHAHSAANDRMILDGTRESGNYLMVVERDGDAWSAPRVLCRHDSSRHGHASHVHARLRADGRQVCFTSNRRGYSDVYLIDVPDDLSGLPEWPGKPYRYYWE